jgi:hypothetical protein
MTRSIAEIHGLLQEAQTAIHRLATKRRAETQPPEDHVWAAIALAKNAATCTSILAGRPVLTANLDPGRLHDALRGAHPPHPNEYLHISDEHLDAILEAGPRPLGDMPPPAQRHATAEIGTQPPRITPPRTWIPR